jgi:hypothetical protein
MSYARNIFVSLLLTVTFFGHAYSMTFEVLIVGGEPAIIGVGPIVHGDADRLKALFIPKNKHSLGYYPLLLNSPGGNVGAAFAISKLMDEYTVYTYVLPGQRCISACAAIVFIAGKEHLVVRDGLLGFHGCYNGQNKEINEMCNEIIAKHALEHGTAYGSVMAFIATTPYDKVIWLSGEDADCWAVNRYQISTKPENYEQCVFDSIRRTLRRQ